MLIIDPNIDAKVVRSFIRKASKKFIPKFKDKSPKIDSLTKGIDETIGILSVIVPIPNNITMYKILCPLLKNSKAQ